MIKYYLYFSGTMLEETRNGREDTQIYEYMDVPQITSQQSLSKLILIIIYNPIYTNNPQSPRKSILIIVKVMYHKPILRVERIISYRYHLIL